MLSLRVVPPVRPVKYRGLSIVRRLRTATTTTTTTRAEERRGRTDEKRGLEMTYGGRSGLLRLMGVARTKLGTSRVEGCLGTDREERLLRERERTEWRKAWLERDPEELNVDQKGFEARSSKKWTLANRVSDRTLTRRPRPL